MNDDAFRCAICQAVQDETLLCITTSDRWTLFCLHCCTCPEHTRTDVDGTVVWPWHGLQDT